MPLQDSDNLIIGRGTSVYRTTYGNLKQKLTEDGLGGGGGGGGGGTAVDFPPSQLPGASLVLQPAALSSDNNLIEFSIDGTNWFPSINANSSDVVQIRWIIDAHDDTPHGGTTETELTYDITNGPTYTQSYSYTVDKLPDAVTYDDGTDTAIGQYVESATTEVMSGVNARTRIWGTTDSTDAVQVQIDGGSWTDIPTTADNSVLFEDGASIKIRHRTSTTPEAVTTSTVYFGWDDANSVNDTYVTTNIDAYITQPSITTPTEGGDVDQNAINLVASAFGGVETGTHNATDWQISTVDDFSIIFSESLDDASNLTSWESPDQAPSDDMTFYARVRYKSDTGLVSAWSETRSMVGRPWSNFKLVTFAMGSRGNEDIHNTGNNGNGAKNTIDLETTRAFATAPGSLQLSNGGISGGSQGSNQSCPGGAGSHATLDGTRIQVAGGGGGAGSNQFGTGAENGGGGGSTGTNPSISNGANGSDMRGAGGGGSPGGGAGTGSGRGGAGGGGYAPEIGDGVTANYVCTARTVGNEYSGRGSGASATLFESYAGGGWTQIGSVSGNYNGSVSGIVIPFLRNLENPFDRLLVKDELNQMTRGEVLDLALKIDPTATVTLLEGRATVSVIETLARAIVRNNNSVNGNPVSYQGYYPLYRYEDDAKAAGDGTCEYIDLSGTHVYYMPNGVEQFLGNYTDED